MKQVWFSALLLTALVGTTEVKAQSGFSLSLKAAPQFSWLMNEDERDDDHLDRKPFFGGGFGLGAAYNFTPAAGVGIDVLYALQGQRYEAAGEEFTQRVNYVKVPVLFSYTTTPGKAVSFVGKIGPQISFRGGSKITDGDGHDLVKDTDERYKGVTFGGVVATGAQFRLRPGLYFTTALRFDHDFTGAEDKDYAVYPAGRSKTYNLSTGVEVGMKYQLHNGR